MENLVVMLTTLKSTYSGKKVFLTGHTGFKGSWLLQILNLLGAEVKGYSLSSNQSLNLYNILDSDSKCNSIIADLRDRDKLIKEITDFQPDFVFHLAAQPLVRLSYQIPAETFEINAIGTANLLDGIRHLEKPCYVVLITTDKIYHNYEWHYPYRENDRLGGYDPYSASKACAELVIDCYRNSFFNPEQYEIHKKGIAVSRAGNVIGGGDWSKDRLVPDIVRALSVGKKVEIRNPNAVRPWQHVLEPLIGYLLLGAKLARYPLRYGQAYNFGPNFNDALSVREMLMLAIDSWGVGDFLIDQAEGQPHEAGLLKLDINKAQSELGWTPKLNASEAVKYTIDWYKVFYNERENIDIYTKQQILDFFKRY